MKKVKNSIKNNIKLLIVFILGFIITGGTIYVAAVTATNVTYTDTYSIGTTTVQAAIDKLVTKTKLGSDTKFIAAYTYNASTCVTGEESTCVATTCYKTKSANSCPAGTIIRYKVRPGEVVTFHVMYDDASTITMQAQKNTVYNKEWITALDYSGTTSSYGIDKGPLTILKLLESATTGWVNVNDQTYTIGDDSSSTNLGYSGCSAYNSCTTNLYTLASRTAKARMITVQEAATLGCTMSYQSCPIWMYNYLRKSTSYGGTVDDTSHGLSNINNDGYWAMNANEGDIAWYLVYMGCSFSGGAHNRTYNGARAVVVVNK